MNSNSLLNMLDVMRLTLTNTTVMFTSNYNTARPWHQGKITKVRYSMICSINGPGTNKF